MNGKSLIRTALFVAFAASTMAVTSVHAAIISSTSAAGINNIGGDGGSGDHYHWGPGSEAQVNYSFGEEGRGVAEFDLSGVGSAVGSALLSFTVSGFKDNYYTPTQFLASINLSGYTGDNTITVSDFQSMLLGSIGSFNAATLMVGDILNFDVTALVNGNLGGSLGVLWDPVGTSPQYSAMTFNNIQISTTVPEPGSLLLVGLGLAGLAGLRRRKS